MVVAKKNGKWRVCADYSDLNAFCPKDYFSLPRIDQIVDATAGHDLLSFMDAYLRYKQIPLHPPDSKKTTFITTDEIYCYNVMSFGLKNASATYQHMANLFILNWQNNISVHRWYVGKVVETRRTFEPFARIFRTPSKIQAKIEPLKVCLWSPIRKILRLSSDEMRYWGKHWTTLDYLKYAFTYHKEGNPSTHRATCCTQSIHFMIFR